MEAAPEASGGGGGAAAEEKKEEAKPEEEEEEEDDVSAFPPSLSPHPERSVCQRHCGRPVTEGSRIGLVGCKHGGAGAPDSIVWCGSLLATWSLHLGSVLTVHQLAAWLSRSPQQTIQSRRHVTNSRGHGERLCACTCYVSACVVCP